MQITFFRLARHWVVKHGCTLLGPIRKIYLGSIKGFLVGAFPCRVGRSPLSSQPPPWVSQANPDLVIGVTLCHYYCVQVSSYYYFSSFSFASCIGDYFVPHLLFTGAPVWALPGPASAAFPRLPIWTVRHLIVGRAWLPVIHF